MSSNLFKLPNPMDALKSARFEDQSIRDFLAKRRSSPIKAFDPNAAGPDNETLTNILIAALRVPDHRNVQPWRLIVIQGDDRATLGEQLAARFKTLTPDASDDMIETERKRLFRAPVCVSIVSSPVQEHKTPVWEQELSAGALCMNLIYMCRAAGFDASWISEWWAFDKDIDRVLGLTESERIAGHMFIGKSAIEPPERNRGDLTSKITSWSAP